MKHQTSNVKVTKLTLCLLFLYITTSQTQHTNSSIKTTTAPRIQRLRKYGGDMGQKILATLQDKINDQLKDDKAKHKISEKGGRMEILILQHIDALRRTARNSREKLANQIPDSLNEWYDKSTRGGYRMTDCGDSDEGCASFLPFDGIWNYGCWCYFSNNAGHGSGQPVDELDAICQELQYCYRCARIDSWNNGEEICSPGQQDYTVSVNHSFMNSNSKAILASCSSHNGDDDCAIHTCCCEMNFIRNLLKLLFAGFQIQYQKYNRKTWDNGMCHGPGHRPTVLDCCGIYPNRVPYSLDKADRECCNNENMYSLITHKCCLDGSVKSRGVSCRNRN